MVCIGRKAQVLARRGMDIRRGNHPSRRRAFSAVLTRVAYTSPSPGRRRVWTSSSQLRSFTWCRLFSTLQWLRNPRSSSFGPHRRELRLVSRYQRSRAWSPGAGPGPGPLTIDLDSTICETYGLGKEGDRHYGYTGQQGYHPLLAVAAGTGDVLMAQLREGRANTARGGAHFLRETLGRVRYGGARGQLTVRADSGFYTHAVAAACRETNVRFSITIRQHQGLRHPI